jgi:hypothetical protein
MAPSGGSVHNSVNGALVKGALELLAHRLRTPLSVISNDLYYLESVLPADELSASRGKVAEISALLKCIAPKQLPLSLQELKAHVSPLELRLQNEAGLHPLQQPMLLADGPRISESLALTLHYLLQAFEAQQEAAPKVVYLEARLARLDSSTCDCFIITLASALEVPLPTFAEFLSKHPSNLLLKLAALNIELTRQQIVMQPEGLLVKEFALLRETAPEEEL